MKKAVYYIVIGYSIIVQGAFFAVPLILLTLFFLMKLLLHKGVWRFDAVALLFFVLSALMSVGMFFSVSGGSAVIELVKYALFALSYLYFIQADEKTLAELDSVFFAGFCLILTFGLLGAWGAALPGFMAATDDGRLQSFLGYANTTALLMGIGIFYCTEKIRERVNANPPLSWRKAISPCAAYMVLAAAFFTAMVLTRSRIALMIFFAVYGLYVFRFVRMRLKLLFAGGVGLLVTGLALLDFRIIRAFVFAPTLVERYISYIDALGILARQPWGIGPGSWQYVHTYYQSARYWVQYVHNFYLQTALDGGILAGLIFTAVVGLVLWRAQRGMHFYIVIFIAVGAVFEVHLNFGAVIIYFTFVCARLRGKDAPFKQLNFGWMKRARYALAVPILALGVLLTSHYFINRGHAYQRQGQSAEANVSYSRAARLAPFDSGLYLLRANAHPDFDRRMEYLRWGYLTNPWNIGTIQSLAEEYLQAGDWERAYYFADRLLTLRPFSRGNQAFMRQVLRHMADAEHITPYRHREMAARLDGRIANIDAGMNRLFRHINPYMRY